MSRFSIVKDQMGRNVEVPEYPQRIVSVVPSQTELLYDLGLDTELVGITKFCIHPDAWFRTKTRVGGTKNINYDTIAKLDPDLIIANKEENTKEQIEYLMERYPVWISDIQTLDQSLQMIHSLGEIANTIEKSNTIANEISERFAQLSTFNFQLSIKKVAYFIWRDPLITIGGDTFISEMLRIAGFQNVFAGTSRYPSIDEAALSEAAPDYIFLSSEPYPFKDKHIKEFQDLCPAAKILLVDGELFSWYGSRLLHAPAYFQQLQQQLNP